LVEDNNDLLNYLVISLGKAFEIVTAMNGKDGWNKIQKQTPDIIVSDIMMPIMDGVELCKKVKEDIKTSHIPIILLTARAGIQNRLDGLEHGADIYIEKPFNSKVLEIHIANLLKLKKSWQRRFETELGIEVSEITRSNRDEEFMKKAIKVVYTNLSNEEFKVTDLIEQMAVSRTLLFMKLTELTGQSASEFIQRIRMKEAARLLSQSDFTITEVAEKTGFSDSSYFTRCFRKHYNITPKAYKQKKGLT
jgi:YesN/AraC family two-component response regulator